MFTAITTGLIVFVVVVLFLFVARRALRLALKLVIVGVMVLLLVACAAYGWWQGWFNSLFKRITRPSKQINARTRTGVLLNGNPPFRRVLLPSFCGRVIT